MRVGGTRHHVDARPLEQGLPRTADGAPPDASDAATTPIACSLEPDAMFGRIDDWQRMVARATGRTAVDSGIALQFAADPDTAGDLARLAAAEQQCCTFFEFRIHVAGPVIVFEVRAPADAHDVVTAMFGTVA